MRQNQQLSQALIHPLTRIHPPVKPAGKASTTHMYTSKTYLAWPDLTVGRDVIYYPPHPPPPPVQPGKANNKHHQQRTCTLRKHVLHSLILQSAGTLLPPPPPRPVQPGKANNNITNLLFPKQLVCWGSSGLSRIGSCHEMILPYLTVSPTVSPSAL